MSKPVFDYGEVLDAMSEKLVLLADHIEEHQLFVGWEYDAQKIRTCVRLIDAVQYEGVFTPHDIKRWKLLWKFVAKYMPGWWC